MYVYKVTHLWLFTYRFFHFMCLFVFWCLRIFLCLLMDTSRISGRKAILVCTEYVRWGSLFCVFVENGDTCGLRRAHLHEDIK